MKYSQAEPPLPTIRRWIDLNRRFPGNSTLRKLEYEKLRDSKIAGRVLDLGGGNKAKYLGILPAGIEYSSINIDPDIEPTWLVEPGEPFPVQDATFDVCMSMNTLEHVYDLKFQRDDLPRLILTRLPLRDNDAQSVQFWYSAAIGIPISSYQLSVDPRDLCEKCRYSCKPFTTC